MIAVYAGMYDALFFYTFACRISLDIIAACRVTAAMVLVIWLACVLIQMVILKACCRDAAVVEALAIQKSRHAVAAVEIVLTAMLFAILFACVIIQMIIVGA